MGKKEKPEITLKPVLKKSVKFYFRNFVLILLLNFLYLTSFYTFFKSVIFLYLSGHMEKYVEIISFGISMGLLYTIKTLLYTITTDNMFKDVINTFGLIFEQFFVRLFPVFATALLVSALTIFLSLASLLIFAIPGIICFIYCMYAIPISAVRSIDTGSIGGKKVLMGAKAIVKSFTIVKGNFIRIVLYNSLICGVLFFLMQIPFFSDFTNANNIDIIKFIISDFVIIFNITAMLTIEKTQQKKEDEQTQRFNKSYHFKR